MQDAVSGVRRRRSEGAGRTARSSVCVEALDDLRRHQIELLRPHRRRAGNRHDAAALGGRLRLDGDRVADRFDHARWTSASIVSGASSSASRPSASVERARRRGAESPSSRHCLGQHLRRRRPRDARRRRSSAPGICSRSVAVITDWPPPARSKSTSARRGGPVELAHHVVEQHHRRRLAPGRDRLALGQQQRQQRQALLPLRAICAQLAALALRRDVIAVGPMASEAAFEIAVHALGELGAQLLRRRSPLTAAGRRARDRRRARARRSSRLNGSAIASTARAAVVHQRDPVARRAARPSWQANRGLRRRRGSGRSARCAAPASARKPGESRRGPATARRRTGPDARGAATALP